MSDDLPPGLQFAPEVFDAAAESRLLAECEAAGWDFSLRRGTRQYGRTYPFRGGPLAPAPPLPEWLGEAFLSARGAFPGLAMAADQCIVNRYLPGEGIAFHTDDRRLFGPDILVVSLGSDVAMTFRHPGGRVVVVPVPRRSAYLMSGEARLRWQHEIPSRKSDAGRRRGTRVSLTFRTVTGRPAT